MTFSPILFVVVVLLVSGFTMAQYEGSWKLTETLEGSESVQRADLIPATTKGVLMTIHKKEQVDNTYSLVASVGNKLMTQVKVLGDETTVGGVDVEVGPVMSTKMLAPPELRPMEKFLADMLPEMKKMYLEEDSLVFSSDKAKILCAKEEDFQY